MSRSRLLCLSDAHGGSSPSLTSDVRRREQMKAHAHRWLVVAAITRLFAGAALSYVLHPGGPPQKIMPTTDTRASHFPREARPAHPCPPRPSSHRFGRNSL